jgi:hypothetical protein
LFLSEHAELAVDGTDTVEVAGRGQHCQRAPVMLGGLHRLLLVVSHHAEQTLAACDAEKVAGLVVDVQRTPAQQRRGREVPAVIGERRQLVVPGRHADDLADLLEHRGGAAVGGLRRAGVHVFHDPQPMESPASPSRLIKYLADLQRVS